MEKILEIKKVDGYKFKPEGYHAYDGFEVVTDKQKILVLIDNDQNCCEKWGYLSSFDDSKEFIGSDLLKIELVDECLNKTELKKIEDEKGDDVQAIFVNFETSKGLFQLTVYNAHNGYYGHKVKIISNNLNIEDTI